MGNISLDVTSFGPFATGALAWGTPPKPLATTCRTAGTAQPTPSGFFKGGGFIQTYCEYELGGAAIRNAADAAKALAPIDSPRKALALVIMHAHLAYQPVVGAKIVQHAMPKGVVASAHGGSVPAFTFEAREGGYWVGAPIAHACPVGVVRETFRVTSAGEVCRAVAPEVVLDVGNGVCAD